MSTDKPLWLVFWQHPENRIVMDLVLVDDYKKAGVVQHTFSDMHGRQNVSITTITINEIPKDVVDYLQTKDAK